LMGVMQAGMERQIFGATRNAAGLKVGRGLPAYRWRWGRSDRR
jgi:hypothetical protein